MLISLTPVCRYQTQLTAAREALAAWATRPAGERDAEAIAADQAWLADLERQRPEMTVALIRYLLEEEAGPEYAEWRGACEAAAQRCRLLREALAAWGETLPPRPIPRTQAASGSQRDRLFMEYRQLEKQGIRLPLFPDDVVLPPSCPQQRERRE